MKTESEIVRAHDILVAMIVGEVPNLLHPGKPFDGSTIQERVMMEQAAALCWILGHDHNPTFGKNLEAINTELERLGFKLRNKNDDETPSNREPGNPAEGN